MFSEMWSFDRESLTPWKRIWISDSPNIAVNSGPSARPQVFIIFFDYFLFCHNINYLRY